MKARTMEQLVLIAADKADYADEKMNKQQTYAYMVADYLRQLYTDPGAYAPGRPAARTRHWRGSCRPSCCTSMRPSTPLPWRRRWP